VPYVVYGATLYATANRRDAVARQADRHLKPGSGFVPSALVEGIPAGTTTWTYLHPADAEPGELTPGQSYPALQFCWQTADYELAQLAESVVADELARGGVVGGWFGTFDAGPG
jgi:hypothetical protein